MQLFKSTLIAIVAFVGFATAIPVYDQAREVRIAISPLYAIPGHTSFDHSGAFLLLALSEDRALFSLKSLLPVHYFGFANLPLLEWVAVGLLMEIPSFGWGESNRHMHLFL